MPGLISRKSESEPIGIGAVSERFGLTHRALRFYEKRGLVDPIRRGRMRFYDDAQQMRLQMLIKCKQLGFSLLEIADLMGAALGPTDQVPEVRLNKETILTQLRHLKARQAEIKQAIAELQIALRQFANAEELISLADFADPLTRVGETKNSPQERIQINRRLRLDREAGSPAN